MNGGGTPALTDREVIRLVRKGHRDYFRILVERYQSRVFSIGLRFFRNRDDAKDFTQDVFLKAFEALPDFRDASPGTRCSFPGWITRISYRYGINRVNRDRKYISLAEEYEPSGIPGPEAHSLKTEIRRALTKAVKNLSEPQLMCIDLSFFYGLRYHEISDITGIPVGTVKSHVFRAKKFLREELKGTEAEDYHDL